MKRKNEVTIIRTLCAMLAVATMLITKIDVRAAGFSKCNELMTAKTNVVVYSQPSTDSSVIVKYNAGDSMYVNGVGSGWIRVYYQGVNGYINNGGANTSDGAAGNTQAATGVGTADAVADDEQELSHEKVLAEVADVLEETEVDLTTIDEEMADISDDLNQEETNLEEIEDANKISVIWIVIIVLIILAMFGLTIYNIIMNKKKKTDDVEDKDGEGEPEPDADNQIEEAELEVEALVDAIENKSKPDDVNDDGIDIIL